MGLGYFNPIDLTWEDADEASGTHKAKSSRGADYNAPTVDIGYPRNFWSHANKLWGMDMRSCIGVPIGYVLETTGRIEIWPGKKDRIRSGQRYTVFPHDVDISREIFC